MTEIQVMSPGMLTTVQDLGRPGYAHLGISASGAADSLALRLGNVLVGNSPVAAALEMTLLGGAFSFSAPTLVALTGSVFAGDAAWFRAFEATELRLGPTTSGARCYLCVRGGIDVPRVLGSASTHLMTGVGGRALQKGDVLRIGHEITGTPLSGAVVPDTRRDTIRVTDGPQRAWFSGSIEGAEYKVAEESNRMGLRLSGPPLECSRSLLTEGVSLGAIQVPAGGQPIITFVEHQTTGGYPKIANVISADFPAVGQLRPRDAVRFEVVPMAHAVELLREQEAWICSLT